MPITFSPAPHNAIAQLRNPPDPLTSDSAGHILSSLRPPDRELVDEVLQSSLVPRDAFKAGARPSSPSESGTDVAAENAFIPQKNGLVHTITKAYNQHHALVLRPDDVWLCILTQFSLFVNGPGRAEALRSQFVSHEGKKTLTVVVPGENRYTVDFGSMAKQMTSLLHEAVVDPALRDWIMPSFTTTTHDDTVATSVVMMATLRAYFDYEFEIECGIPRVTLLGERSDWESILHRLEKLKEYGPETKAWYQMLQPVMRRFVLAFDDGYADSDENREFWQRVAHYASGGSGPTYLSGWIVAFCAFDDDGKWVGGSLDSCDEDPSPSSLTFNDEAATEAAHNLSHPENVLFLDGVSYHSIDSSKIPTAHAEVPIKLNDNGQEFDAAMLAGVVGTSVTNSGVDEGLQDQVSPVVGWWMYTVQKGKTGMKGW